MALRLVLPALLAALALARGAAACTVDLGPFVHEDLGAVEVVVHHSTCPDGERYVEVRVLDTTLHVPLPA